MSREEQITELTKKRDDLIERLDVGASRIEEGKAKGKNVDEWEDYWIVLLRQYENVCDKLRELSKSAPSTSESEGASAEKSA